ncbi:MAG: hypothetical protein JJU45_18825 [Acidimicrobiia bacterium]|nr:hypothetical protein [Acidimicrobiia bacterium]
MRRLIATAAVGALALAACSSESTEDAASDTAPTTDLVDAAPAAAGGVYLVQEAGPATLASQGTDFELTLTEVSPRTVVFTGEPDPSAATAPTSNVVEVLDDSETPHDAALSWTSPSGTGTVVVTILSGTYDDQNDTLTYTVRPIEPSATDSATVAAHATARGAATGSAEELAATIPTDVTASTLFVDPVGQDQAEANCQLTVVNDSAFDGKVDDIHQSDSGGMADWDTPFTVDQPLPAGGTISASSGNSAWDCHATVEFGFTDSIGDFYGVFLTLRDPVFDTSTWSCSGPPELGCDVEANDEGQPLEMTVTISD